MVRSSGSDAALFLFLFLYLSFSLSSCHALQCSPSKCSDGRPEIRFPFRLRGQPERCGYAGFELTCYGNDTILPVPSSLNLSVTEISYSENTISIVNPYNCFQELLLHLNLTASPFSGPVDDLYFKYHVYGQDNYTFVACTVDRIISGGSIYYEIPCRRNNTGYHIFFLNSDVNLAALGEGSCQLIRNVNAPSYLSDRYSFLLQQSHLYLLWYVNGCEECGGTCRYENDATNQTECFYSHYYDHSAHKGVSVAIFLLIVVSIISIEVYQSQRSDRKKEMENQLRIEKFLEGYKSLKPIRYSYLDMKRMTDRFRHKLGQGGYGTVLKGKLPNGTLLAVKTLKKSSGSNGEEFINEVGTNGRIHHVNVVRLLGFGADRYERAFIYEFMPNESLEKFIFSLDENNSLLGWEKLRGIAIGIANETMPENLESTDLTVISE